jgi:hypothetical protein
MKSILAIDPGLQGTGLALWDRKERLVATAVVTVRGRSEDWVTRCETIVKMTSMWTRGQGIELDRVVCEMMEHHGSAKSSMIWRSGDLQRTLVLVGMLARWGAANKKALVELIPPSEWKGQLPKRIVEQRINKRLTLPVVKQLGIKTHAYDAVGIGLWALGRF